MNIKELAEVAYGMWRRMETRPTHEKAAIIENLTTWWRAENAEQAQQQLQAQHTHLFNAQTQPQATVKDERYQA